MPLACLFIYIKSYRLYSVSNLIPTSNHPDHSEPWVFLFEMPTGFCTVLFSAWEVTNICYLRLLLSVPQLPECSEGKDSVYHYFIDPQCISTAPQRFLKRRKD